MSVHPRTCAATRATLPTVSHIIKHTNLRLGCSSAGRRDVLSAAVNDIPHALRIYNTHRQNATS